MSDTKQQKKEGKEKEEKLWKLGDENRKLLQENLILREEARSNRFVYCHIIYKEDCIYLQSSNQSY